MWPMNVLIALFLTLPCVATQPDSGVRVPLLREGTRVIEANGQLHRESDEHPVVIQIPLQKEGGRLVDQFIVLPNRRLAEMEAASAEFPNRSFQVSGDVFAYGDHNYLLIREALSLGEHAERNHPTSIPIRPSEESLDVEDFDDSIADIVDELEQATGSLVRSIRSAANNPVQADTIKEGSRISSRRCHLVRNTTGAWVAIFVADSTGLSDPPCTILPSVSFAELTAWASKNNPSTPVLLSGEVLNYHGHGFLLVHSWRPVHQTDHLD